MLPKQPIQVMLCNKHDFTSIMVIIIAVTILGIHWLEHDAIHPDHIGVAHAAQQCSLLDQLCYCCLPSSITTLRCKILVLFLIENHQIHLRKLADQHSLQCDRYRAQPAALYLSFRRTSQTLAMHGSCFAMYNTAEALVHIIFGHKAVVGTSHPPAIRGNAAISIAGHCMLLGNVTEFWCSPKYRHCMTKIPARATATV